MLHRVYRFADAAGHAAARAQQAPAAEIVVGPAGDPPGGCWVLAAWAAGEAAAWAAARQPEASAPVWWSGVPLSAAEPQALVIRREDMPALTPLQFRAALRAAGLTAAQVEAQLNAIPDAPAREEALDRWRFAQSFLRADPLLAQVAAALGLSAEQVDALWLAAAAGN